MMELDNPRSREMAPDIAELLWEELEDALKIRKEVGTYGHSGKEVFLLVSDFSPRRPLEAQLRDRWDRHTLDGIIDMGDWVDRGHFAPYVESSVFVSDLLQRLREGLGIEEARNLIGKVEEPRAVQLVVGREALLGALSGYWSLGYTSFDVSHQQLADGPLVICDMYQRFDSMDDYCVTCCEPKCGVGVFIPKSAGCISGLNLVAMTDLDLIGTGEVLNFRADWGDEAASEILGAIEDSARCSAYEPTQFAAMSLHQRREFFAGVSQLVFVSSERSLLACWASTEVKGMRWRILTSDWIEIEPSVVGIREFAKRMWDI